MGDSLDEAARVVRELERFFDVHALERVNSGGLDVTVVDLGLVRGRRVIVAVLPEATEVNVRNSRRALAAASFIASELGGPSTRQTIIIYSRRGRLTRTAYLYLGFSTSRGENDIIVVNGPPREVADLLALLKATGIIAPREDRVYPAKI